MSRGDWTLMLIPHDDERVRTFDVASAYVRRVLVAILLAVFAGWVVFGVLFVLQLARADSPPENFRAEMLVLQEVTERRLAEADRRLADLRSEREARVQEIAELQTRYDALAALAEGQEEIARAHRVILSHRRWSERIVEQGFALMTGIAATLLAQFLILPRVARVGGQRTNGEQWQK